MASVIVMLYTAGWMGTMLLAVSRILDVVERGRQEKL